MPVLDTILQRLADYLDNQETHTALETVLNDAVKKSVVEPDLRSNVGGSSEFWRLACPSLKELVSNPHADACLLALLKLARNVVAGNLTNQRLAIEGGALVATEEVLRSRSQVHVGLPIIQAGVQAICNFLTGNTEALNSVWDEWMGLEDRGTIYSELLTVNDDVVVMSTMVLVLNCIKHAPSRCQRMVASKTGLKIVGAILDDLEHLHNNESSKNFELGYSILSQLIDSTHFGALYTNMGIPAATASSHGDMNGRRAMLLKVLDSKVHSQQEGQGLPPYIKEDDWRLVGGLVSDLSKQAIQAIEQATREEGTIAMDNVTEVYTALVLVLQLTASLLTMETQGPLREYLIKLDVMGMVTELLGCCETMKKPGFNYLKRDIVRLMGILCYKDRRMQDRVREAGGIPLILAQCKIDDANPYIREYAVLAIRHLLEDNPENQALISEMEPLQAVQTDELSEMGLTARLENGKVKLSKRE